MSDRLHITRNLCNFTSQSYRLH